MISTTLRIDSDLYEKISRIAYLEKRSINSQIIIIFKEYLNMYKWTKK